MQKKNTTLKNTAEKIKAEKVKNCEEIHEQRKKNKTISKHLQEAKREKKPNKHQGAYGCLLYSPISFCIFT